jgi:hypothetical protein
MKRIIVIACFLTLALGALVAGRDGQSRKAPKLEPVDIPDHVVYKHLFHHVAALQRKAEEAESEGKDSTQFRTHFKRQAQLSSKQADTLDQIALDCDRDMKSVDERARVIIQQYKAQYPGGQVPHGEEPKPPPAELRQLTEERDAVVMRARDRLKQALGDEEFARFNGYVKERVAPNVYQLSPKKDAAQSAKP